MQIYSRTRAQTLYLSDKANHRKVAWGFWQKWATRLYQGVGIVSLSLFTPEGTQQSHTVLITEFAGTPCVIPRQMAHGLLNMREVREFKDWSKRVTTVENDVLDSGVIAFMLRSGASLKRDLDTGLYFLRSNHPGNEDLLSLLP